MAGLGDQNQGAWGDWPSGGDMEQTVDLNALRESRGAESAWEQTMRAPAGQNAAPSGQMPGNSGYPGAGEWGGQGTGQAPYGAPNQGFRNPSGQGGWNGQGQGVPGGMNPNQGGWNQPGQAGPGGWNGPPQGAFGGMNPNQGPSGTWESPDPRSGGSMSSFGAPGTGMPDRTGRGTGNGGKKNRKRTGGGGRRQKGGGMGPVRIIILVAALGVFAFAAFRLGSMLLDYKAADDQYNNISESYTNSAPANPTPTPATVSPNVIPNAEDAPSPKVVDWAALKAKNPDVVGWIYMNVPGGTIDYPIVKGKDNDQYLHTGFDGNYLYAGSIFMDSYNSSDFSDGNTIIYGHNMKNKSMFARLRDITESSYQSDPYFWILTPNGDYRYHIYSIADVAIDNDVYALWRGYEPDFIDWEKKIQGQSMFGNSVQFEAGDHTVTLSTCTNEGTMRRVVVGKCVSTSRPAVNSEPTGAETVAEDGVPLEG